MSNVRYRSGALVVTDTIFRTARRTYRIADIEKIGFKRPLFWMTVPLAIGSYFLLSEFEPYLYPIERQICMGMYTALPVLSWFVVTLSVSSKSYRNDTAVTGLEWAMSKVRTAIEDVMFQQVAPEPSRLFVDKELADE